MLEWIRLIIILVLFAIGVAVIGIAVFGAYKYKFCLNRMHTAAILDTLGVLCMMSALILYLGFDVASLKLFAVLLFLWIGGPVSSHFIARFEVTVDAENVKEECEEVKENQ